MKPCFCMCVCVCVYPLYSYSLHFYKIRYQISLNYPSILHEVANINIMYELQLLP